MLQAQNVAAVPALFSHSLDPKRTFEATDSLPESGR